MLRTTFSLLAAAATLAAGCGSDDSDGSSDRGAATAATPTTTEAATSSTASTGGAAGAGSSLHLAADAGGGLKFDRAKLTAKAGTVTITMKNPSSSGIPHAIAVEGHGVDQDGQTAEPGGTSTVRVKLKPGTYSFYCPVGQHEQAGMKGTLVVH